MQDLRRKIIIVDDVNYHLLSTKERLKKYYEIHSAQSTESLFRVLEKITPDLVLLDINMSENYGYEAIKQLKAEPRFANIPVIFLTSKYDKGSVTKGMSLGAADFVTKPFLDTKLIEHIEYQFDSVKQNVNKPIL